MKRSTRLSDLLAAGAEMVERAETRPRERAATPDAELAHLIVRRRRITSWIETYDCLGLTTAADGLASDLEQVQVAIEHLQQLTAGGSK